MTIAERLHALRKSRNLSIERLATLIHTNDCLVGQHEQGKVSPNLYTAQRYADVYGLSLAELLEGVEVR